MAALLPCWRCCACTHRPPLRPLSAVCLPFQIELSLVLCAQAPRPPQRAAFDATLLLHGTPRAFEAGLQAAYGLHPGMPAPDFANDFRHGNGLSPAQPAAHGGNATPDGHSAAARAPPQQAQPAMGLSSGPQPRADGLQREAPRGLLLPGQDSSAGAVAT